MSVNINKAVLVMFEVFGKEDKEKLMEFYCEELSKYDEETILARINYLIKTSKFFPKPADILEVVVPDLKTEMERDWKIFLDTKGNEYRFLPVEPWVLSIKEHIGILRCDDILEDEVYFLKIDFEKAYPLLKKGIIQVKPQGNSYVTLPGTSIKALLPKNIDAERFKNLIDNSVPLTPALAAQQDQLLSKEVSRLSCL